MKMSQIGKTIKNLEAPRPLKSRSSHQIRNFMILEELIQLVENVAMALASGISNPDSMAILMSNLRINGPQLETVAKDNLDRAFITFRNASQDERLNIMTRLNLLELIELRAKSWKDDGINLYYRQKAHSVEPDNGSATGYLDQSTLISTSPTSMAGLSLGHASAATHNILGPGEVLRASGKFTKPTKIPGKNYSKDEVVIRNADSGKVNPGAKERLVQITGPNEDKITYAKHLIEDTIRRNASPVRLDSSAIGGGTTQGGAAGGGGGSCSSLASSASDEAVPRANNRNSIGAMMGGLVGLTNQPSYIVGSNYGGLMMAAGPGGKLIRSASHHHHPLLLSHSYSTNDASVGEYKYTVNIGQHLVKITGDNCELVRIAKLVLDDYFSSNEFLASVEAGVAYDGPTSLLSSATTPTTPHSAPVFPSAHPLVSSPYADSGIGLNYMASHGIANSNIPEGDDDVFIVEPSGKLTKPATHLNGLARSRRSHFSRKDSAPDGVASKKGTEVVASSASKGEDRIVHEYERLIFYSKSPHSWALPRDWNKIVEKHPSLVRNKELNDEQHRFDADKYMALVKSGKRILAATAETESPDLE